MKNERVLSGLVRKRAEIAGRVEHAKADLGKMAADLAAIDAAIAVFDPNVDVASLPKRSYRPRRPVLQGLSRYVMDTLRTADGPLTSRAIAAAALSSRGASPEDEALLQTAHKRVRACLFKLKRRGLAEGLPQVDGGPLEWVRT